MKYSRLKMTLFLLVCAGTLVLGTLPQNVAVHMTASDKIDHFAAFAVLMIIGLIAFSPHDYLWLGLGLIGFGGLIEALQVIPSLNRSPDLFDWLVEVAAVLLFGGIGFAVNVWQKHFVKKPAN